MGATAAIMAFARQWPPNLPYDTILGSAPWKAVAALRDKARDSWTADDWRMYAEYLEVRGRELLRDLQNAERDRDELKRKLGRKPKPTGVPSSKAGARTILGQSVSAAGRRGRKESARWRIAGEILATQEAMTRQRGGKVSTQEAADAWAVQKGLQGWHARDHRSVINDVSALRIQNNSPR